MRPSFFLLDHGPPIHHIGVAIRRCQYEWGGRPRDRCVEAGVTISSPARPHTLMHAFLPCTAEEQLVRWRETPFGEPLRLNAPATPELLQQMKVEGGKINRAEIKPALRIVLGVVPDDDPLPRRMLSAARGCLVASGWYSIRQMVDRDGAPTSELEALVAHCRTTCE